MGMLLTLNGQVKNLEALEDGAALDVVIVALEMKADRVAVELNGEIVPRRRWPEQRVNGGDKLEVVHFVGGGAGPA